MKSQVQYIKIKLNWLLMAYFKKALRRKQTMWLSEDSTQHTNA